MSETVVMTLSEFLLARIAERESVARDMKDQARLGRPFFRTDELAGGTGIRELIDPDRVLAECEAKRRIVGRHDVVDTAGGCAFCGEPAPCEHLRILASVYVGHPDYPRGSGS